MLSRLVPCDLAFYRKEYDKAFIEAQKINMPQMLWDPLFRLISAARLNEAGECEQAYSDMIELFPNFKGNKKTIIRRSIPNDEYVDLILEGLEAAQQLMK